MSAELSLSAAPDRWSSSERRNVLLLALSQAAVMTSVSLVLASSVVIGVSLSSPAWATLPLAVQYLATMAVLYPLARLVARYGARPVFAGGAVVGAVGLGVAALGLWLHSFALFVLAGVLLGVFSAVGQYYRFVAAEAVPAARRSTAISLTLSGGVLAAMLGPNLARWSRELLTPAFTASFLVLVGVALLAAVLALGLRLPARQVAPTVSDAAELPSLQQLLRRSEVQLAVVAGVVGYGLMNLLMTATPLAMLCSEHGFGATATVIQWHVVAMFAPSFFTGHLIQRWGALSVMGLGALAMVGCVAVAVSGDALPYFEAALILLGIGWNFLYVGATSRLLECCPAAMKPRVQAFNDTLVFLVIALVTFSTGPLMERLGWQTLNLLALLPLSGLLVWLAVAWKRGVAVGAV